MIDIHCHILPGVDDGANNLNEAVEMARLAWENGSRAIVATPHCSHPNMRGNFLTLDLLTRIEQLEQQIRDAGIAMRLYPGMEVFVTNDFPRQLDQGRLLPLAGTRYLLMEFSFEEGEEFMEQMFQIAISRGLQPVVAHPERYYAVQWDPQIIRRWCQMGCVIQVNQGSIFGRLGERAYDCAWTLLRQGLVHVVASDAHGTEKRKPDLQACFLKLAEKLSWGYAAMLLTENPERILWNRELKNGINLPE